ncbi:MAG: alpha-L-fucosidase C-terminal domain-containing protein, partial [Candidatus Hodarchaeota archaeon]
KANGEIPDEVKERLLALGKWIKTNEEGIFNSTPWVLAEEGPTKLGDIKGHGFNEDKEFAYSEKDIRFVAKDNALYAFCLGWPGKELQIRSLTAPPAIPIPKEFYILEDSDIKSISLLGHDGTLDWKLTSMGLQITLPDKKPCEHACTFKIQWT